MKKPEEFDLTRRRQRRFGLIENEDALPFASFLEEPQKTFTVRMGKKVGRGSADAAPGEECLDPSLFLSILQLRRELGGLDPGKPSAPS